MLSIITPELGMKLGPWAKIENRERELATWLGVPVYVLSGPLFERILKPLPNGGVYQRVPSGYWKMVALGDSRATALVFDQADVRSADLCGARVLIRHVELRSRLRLFFNGIAPAASLDAEFGCASAPPADPRPAELSAPLRVRSGVRRAPPVP